MKIEPIIWKNSKLLLLDQTRIPGRTEYIEITSIDETVLAIKNMIVRGAPAIAIAGMFGLALFFIQQDGKPEYGDVSIQLDKLLGSRPTAVNLKLAIDGFRKIFSQKDYLLMPLEKIREKAIQYALRTFNEDVNQNEKLALNAMALFDQNKKKISVLTHCNTGALATAGHGTALGIIRTLKEKGFTVTVYADETRPYLQGSRLTAWEMLQEGIECFIITDSMAGWLMSEGKVDAVIVGADRIASNGDTANKIGTYSLSILAKAHSIPFYVAATNTSFDTNLKTGKEIEIEMRSEDELLRYSFLKKEDGSPLFDHGLFSPEGAKALNPAFDVTPRENITAIITEKGLVANPNKEKVLNLLANTQKQ